MRFDSFLGGSQETQAFTASQERTVNWYPEKQPDGSLMLLPVPGVEPVSVVYDGVGRAHISIGGREFGAFGDTLYEIFEDGSRLSAGSLYNNQPGYDQDITPMTIDSNGDLGSELLIVNDRFATSVDLTVTPSVVANIAALAGKSTMGGYLDGYGLCLDASTSTLYISNLADFTTWTTGTDFAQRSLAADPWKSMKVVGRYIWLFGEYTTEIWWDTGGRFPFSPRTDALLDWGIRAQYSAANMSNHGVMWLAQNKYGRVAVVQSVGVNPQVVSTPAIEYQISQLTDISSAWGDSYSWNGHDFYLLNFDNDGVTLCFDATTGFWHQRGTWNVFTGEYQAWSPRNFVLAFGEIRSQDRMISVPANEVDSASTSSFVYRLTDDFQVDVDGKPIRRERRSPVLNKEDRRLFFHDFQVEMDVGEAEQKETAGTVALTGQTASIADTVIFTEDSTPESYVVDCNLTVTTLTADYSISVNIWWYVAGTQRGHRFGTLTENDAYLSKSISIRPDANTAVSYTTTYASPSGTMAYKLDLDVYQPGVTDPQIMMRMSDDAGRTWSSEKWASAGRLGEYGTRVNWHRLGAARRRVFEVVQSDPVAVKLTGASLSLTEDKV